MVVTRLLPQSNFAKEDISDPILEHAHSAFWEQIIDVCLHLRILSSDSVRTPHLRICRMYRNVNLHVKLRRSPSFFH